MTTMGIALRELGGKGPIEVLTRQRDFNLQEMQGPGGEKQVIPCDTLVAFSATSFRELKDNSAAPDRPTDVWEFRMTQPTAGGPANALLYLRGQDVFSIRVLSQVVT